MRITVLQDYLRRGGTERQSVLLCKEFHAAGHQVQLLTFRPGGPVGVEVRDAGLELHALTARDYRLNFLAPGMTGQLRRRRDDVVLCMGRVANAFAGILQRRLGATRVIGSVRTGKLLPYLNWRSFQRLPAVVTNTAWWKSQLQERGLSHPRIEVIPNGLSFDWQATENAKYAKAIRKTLGLGYDQCLFLNVAGFRRGKRQGALLNVLRSLQSLNDWQMVFVGDGPYRAQCERQAKAAGLAARIHFVGWKDDPGPYYAAADVALSMSVEDALPNFLVEAQFAGLPVLAYRYRGVPEAVDQGRSGFVCTSEAQYREHLLALLADDTKRKRLGEHGAQWARTRFDPQASAAAHLQLFEDLLDANADRN